MSYTLKNTLHGFSVWFSGGGWIVLSVIAVIIILALTIINKRLK